MRPEDAPFLYNAAGIVTTGGGILSHAGLLAVQFRKPALIVAGRWERTDSGAPILQFVSVHYEIEEKELHGYQVCFRRNLREREHTLHEGDLLVLEAGESTLRILGQDGDTLALHESMRELNRVTAELAQTSREHEILRLRGDRIRARHHIENVLQRLGDPPLICHAVSGLLTGSTLSAGEIQRLLCILLNNPAAASTAQRHLDWKAAKLLEQFEDASGAAQRRIPDSDSLYEILNLRLDVLHAHHTLHDAWVACPTPKSTNAPPKQDIDRMIDKLALDRLACLQQLASERVASLCQPTVTPLCRHVLHQGERLDLLIGSSPTIHTLTAVARDRLFELDRRSRDLAADRLVVWPEDGGLELFPVVGWKAANLAEIARATARPIVPGWFVVTDRAFQRALDSKLDRALATGFPAGINLLGAIQTALRNDRFNDQQQSALIRTLWDAVILPGELVEQVLNAYRHLAQQVPPDDQQLQQRTEPMVALRSSSHEEDAEFATRAGEFDTFLFIRGARQLMDFLRRTWAGLWSERALHHRSVLGTSLALVGGGVIVQRIVDARVSGVVQTVNLALNDYRQMVVNVGLGLGQGIVSGAVAADHVVIDKCAMPPQSPLRFRYTTAEKREAVVFDRRAGYGTVQCGAPFHRRRRPALEYAELCELVSVVTELESIYGYPLDIEFALEGTKLWILQARPVPASMNSFQESVSTWTLPHTTHTSSSPQGHHTHDQARRVS